MSGQNRHGRIVSSGAALTFVDHVRSDGLIVRWESRRHRKHLTETPGHGSTWWAPHARAWWIAILFAVGSLLFALGATPGYASAVGARGDTVTFFIGSLFFTSAAFLTYREAVDAAPPAQNPKHRRFFVYQPRRIDSVGDSRATCRNALLQHQHRSRHADQPVRTDRRSACVAT